MTTDEQQQAPHGPGGIAGKHYGHIKGWGIDANPGNDPTYPMRKRDNDDARGYDWERPPLQEEDVEVLQSNERDNMTAVFGTAVPPSGLSGVFRRMAFKYSESDLRHWLSLMAADRINMCEGVGHDLARGRIPNVIAERGLKAEWKYNKKACIRKAAITAAAITAGVALIMLKKKRAK